MQIEPIPIKNSTLGILALVFSVLGCLSLVGIVLAIIDLCRKEPVRITYAPVSHRNRHIFLRCFSCTSFVFPSYFFVSHFATLSQTRQTAAQINYQRVQQARAEPERRRQEQEELIEAYHRREFAINLSALHMPRSLIVTDISFRIQNHAQFMKINRKRIQSKNIKLEKHGR